MIWLARFKTIVNVSTAAIIILSIYVYTIQSRGEKAVPVQVHDPLIFVSILSARENFENRRAIRETWGKWTKTTDADLKFVIGGECWVPPDDRVFDQSCTDIKWLNERNYDNTFWSNTFTSSLPTQRSLKGFAFIVNFPVVLISVKLARWGQTEGQTLVTVINAHTLEQLDSLQFSSFSQDEAELKAQPYLLPRGFEGIVYVHGESKSANRSCHLWTDYGDFIKPIWLIDNDSTLPIEANGGCVPVAISFRFTGVGKFLQEREQRLHQWKEHVETVSRNLKEENETYGDILFVETVDVYRNLTSKMLDVLRWVSNQRRHSFLLKVDDDTFVDLEKMANYISGIAVEVKDKVWWWSDLKRNRAVGRFGKWSDKAYLSLVYPPFPCGAAYVISPLFASLLGKNASFLVKYPFEDTALGLWIHSANISPIVGQSNVCRMDCGTRLDDCMFASCFILQCKSGDMQRLMKSHKDRGFVC